MTMPATPRAQQFADLQERKHIAAYTAHALAAFDPDLAIEPDGSIEMDYEPVPGEEIPVRPVRCHRPGLYILLVGAVWPLKVVVRK